MRQSMLRDYEAEGSVSERSVLPGQALTGDHDLIPIKAILANWAENRAWAYVQHVINDRDLSAPIPLSAIRTLN
jgi:hypothetical protein